MIIRLLIQAAAAAALIAWSFRTAPAAKRHDGWAAEFIADATATANSIGAVLALITVAEIVLRLILLSRG